MYKKKELRLTKSLNSKNNQIYYKLYLASLMAWARSMYFSTFT